jgi:hypothetical protein
MIKKLFLNRLSKTIEQSPEPIGYQRSNTVGILALDEFQSQLDEVTRSLEQDGKRPRIVSFVPNPIKNQTYPKHSFTPKDISITGTILADELLYFTKQSYDFLLCFDPSGSKFIKYLLAKTSARHRIGLFHPNFEGHLDMMVKPDNTTNAVKDVMTYVKMIRND